MKKSILYKICVFFAAVLMTFSQSVIAASDSKEIVHSFYQAVFVEKDVINGAENFLIEDYIQHNPFLESGRKPLIAFFTSYFAKHPESTIRIKRLIGEGDLVVVHSFWRKNPKDKGLAVMDIFRVEEGKIVEHWDVSQKIPETSANKNGMF